MNDYKYSEIDNNSIGEYVCYCNQVTEKDIERAIEKGAETVKEVILATGAMKSPNCRENNPNKK